MPLEIKADIKADITSGKIISELKRTDTDSTTYKFIKATAEIINSDNQDQYITCTASLSTSVELGATLTISRCMIPYQNFYIKWTIMCRTTASMANPDEVTTTTPILTSCVAPDITIIGQDKSYACYMDALVAPQRNAMVSVHNTLQSKYPFVVYNSLNMYDSGTAEGFWAEWNEELQDFDFNVVSNAKFRNEIKEFLYDFKPKLLYYRDGRKWLVGISDPAISETRQASDQHTKLSFGWTEIGESSEENLLNYGIYSKGVIQ